MSDATAIDQVLDGIRERMRMRGWTVYQLARRAGVGAYGLRPFDPGWDPKASTLRKVERALDGGDSHAGGADDSGE